MRGRRLLQFIGERLSMLAVVKTVETRPFSVPIPRTRRMKRAIQRPNWFGSLLGMGVGLLFDSTLLFLGGEGTIWVTALSLGLLLIVPVVLGARFGSAAAEKGIVPSLAPRWIALAAIVIWPVCALLPLGVGVLHLPSGLSEIPVYPNSRLIERNVTIFATDGLPPSVEIEFETTDGAGKVLGFYDRELPHRGWILIADEDRSRIQFAKEDRIGFVRGCEVGPGANRFEITYFIVHKALTREKGQAFRLFGVTSVSQSMAEKSQTTQIKEKWRGSSISRILCSALRRGLRRPTSHCGDHSSRPQIALGLEQSTRGSLRSRVSATLGPGRPSPPI